MNYFKNTIEKFSTSSLSVVLLGVIIVTSNLVWFLPTISSLRESVGDIEKATAKIAVAQIDGFLSAKENDVKVPLRFIREDLRDVENALLVQKILKEEHFTSVALSDKNGNEVIKYDKFKTVFPEDLQNVLERQDFKKVLRTGQVVWSEVTVSSKLEPSITLNFPVFSATKELVGVVSAVISVSPIFKTLADVDTGQGKFYVVDNSGVLISDPDLSLVLKGVDYSSRKVVNDALSESQSITSAYDDTYAYENEKGVQVLSVAAKISKTDWVVVFEEPRGPALQNITKLTVFAVGSFTFVSFLIFLMRKVYLKVIAGRKELEVNLLAQKELFKKVEESKKDIEAVNSHLKEKDDKLAEKVKEFENFQKFVVDREVRMIELKQEIAALKKKLEEGIPKQS
ncbi:MAG: cache domain-containing protein [Patescibacteria group bacterium]